MKIITHMMSRFNNSHLNQLIESIYLKHLKDLTPVDYKVGLMALSVVHQLFEQYDYTLNDRDNFEGLLTKLKNISHNYNDRTGEYTNGRGEIGSFTIDFEREMRSILWPKHQIL